jgi:CHAD domain-containing protein
MQGSASEGGTGVREPFSGGGWARFAATAGAVATAYLAMRQLGSREAVSLDPTSDANTSVTAGESGDTQRRWWAPKGAWPFGVRSQGPNRTPETVKRGGGRGSPARAALGASQEVVMTTAPISNKARRKADRDAARAARRVAAAVAAPPKPPKPPRPARDSEVALLTLHGHLSKALAQIDGASIGEEPEFIHRLRTSSRRARVAARVWARPLGTTLGAREVKRVGVALRTVGRAAGPVRDLDVWVGSLPGIAKREAPDVDVAPLVALAEEHRQAALTDFRRMMDDPEVAWLRHTFLPRIAARCAHLHETDESVRMTLRASWKKPTEEAIAYIERMGVPLSGWAARRAEAIRNGVSAIEAAQPFVEEVFAHDVRLIGKRVRYTIELFQNCWDQPAATDAMAAGVASYTAIQESLGDWHDHIVWHDRIVEGAEILAVRNAEARASAPDGTTPEMIDIAPFLRLSAHIRQSKARTFDAIAATWESRLAMSALARAVGKATKS